MNRLSCVAVLITIALSLLVPVAPASALADPIGGVLIIPGFGTNLDPLRLRTSSGCSAQSSAYYATMHGHGLPFDGQIITSTIEARLSHSIGFDVYPALVMQDYADQNHTTLSGRYDITVFCTDRFALKSYGEFTGSLDFTSPTTYEAIGAAKPVGAPPPPLSIAGDAPILAPHSASRGTGPAAAPRQEPTADAQPPSHAGQLASQRTDVTVRDVPWLLLVVVGALFGGLVAVVVTRQIQKRGLP